MSKYLDEKGYFKGDSVFKEKSPFVFVLGGRGTGKTYGVGKWLCDHCSEREKFILMRRTQREMDFINTGNIYSEHHPNVEVVTKRKKIPTVERDGIVIGYHIALSAISHIRGFSMSDVAYILFDEFIAERGTAVRQYQGEQMLNAYETINRNRELDGKPPVKCVFLSNFNDTENDIMDVFGFTDELYKYKDSKPIGIYRDELKTLIMINDSPISRKKAETVLYRAQQNAEFAAMALNNNGAAAIMPIEHHSRDAYEYVETLGKVNINHLHRGGFYLTAAMKPTIPGTKDILRNQRVWQAYKCGNVSASDAYTAEEFVHIMDG